VQVSTLRRIIGSNVVSTIPGHGYRFVAALALSERPHDLDSV
jgi:DNA-binding winged helix-turn-helix (wHTH) protein